MSTPAQDAAHALAAMRDSRAQLAAAATCPPERHLAFSGLMGALVASQAAPSPYPLFIEAGLLPLIGLIIAWDRKRMGMFVNGYRNGRTLWVTFAMLAVTIAALFAGLWLKEEAGLPWAPLPLAAVVAVIAWFGSRLWQRIYVRELRETP